MGNNIDGQLGNKNPDAVYDTPKRVEIQYTINSIGVGRNFCLALSNYNNDNKQYLVGWGNNQMGQINPFSK